MCPGLRPLPLPPRNGVSHLTTRRLKDPFLWALVKGTHSLSYHNNETILPTIDPYYGNLNKVLNKNTVLAEFLQAA